MIHSCLTRIGNQQLRAVSVAILAFSLLLIGIFITSCGDEGDIVEEETNGMAEVLQPTTTPPIIEAPIPAENPVVVEEPIVEEPKVSFKDDIMPILAERCAIAGCHAAPGVAGLNLSQYDTFKNGGNGGPGFVAGNGEGSLVVKRIDGGGMPPIPPPLNGDEIQLFIDWIDEGAENN